MCSPRRPRRCTRAPATRSPRFINAPSRDEVIFTKNASESLNLVANMLGWADEPYRVDHETEIVITEMEHHSNIVPWQLLAQRTGREAEVVRPDRRRPSRPVQHRRGHHREDEDRLLRAGLQHPGHGQPGRGDRPPRAGGRRAGADRRLAGRAAHAGRRAGARRGLRGLHRPQDVRPDRHRRAVGPAGTARGPAAVPRRRRDDRDRVDALVDVRAGAAQVRGGYAPDRPGRRSRRGGGLPERHRHGQGRRP